MKTLITYYTRTNTTKKLAQAMAESLKCDVEEIIDTKKRSGPIGFVAGGRDAVMKKLTKIKPVKKDPSAYDMVIIGTPNWGKNMTPAIRTYLTENKDKFKKMAYFVVQGSTRQEQADGVYASLDELTGKKPVSKMFCSEKEMKKDMFESKLSAFVDSLKK